jgi:hypothetical protein
MFWSRKPKLELGKQPVPLARLKGCTHIRSYARAHDLVGTLYCPDCHDTLDRAESVNVVLTLLKKAVQ